MTLADYVISRIPVGRTDFLTPFMEQYNQIENSQDLLNFLAQWAARDDADVNIYRNSWFGVVQQFRGLLENGDNAYINERSAFWFDGSSLRAFLLEICENY
jgi:hypothetical protein